MKKYFKFILIFAMMSMGIIAFMYFRNSSVIMNRNRDDFSKAIIRDVGDYVILSGINIDSDKSETQYIFYSKMWNEEQISKFVQAINSNAGLAEGKVSVELTHGNGLIGPVFVLYNYEEENDEVTIYDGFYRLYRTSLFMESNIWGDPILFVNVFSGIRQLEMFDNFKVMADERGIEWDKVWPELEKITVYEREDNGEVREMVIFDK